MCRKEHDGITYSKCENNKITKDDKEFFIYHDSKFKNFILTDETENIVEDSRNYTDNFITRLKLRLGYKIDSQLSK